MSSVSCLCVILSGKLALNVVLRFCDSHGTPIYVVDDIVFIGGRGGGAELELAVCLLACLLIPDNKKQIRQCCGNREGKGEGVGRLERGEGRERKEMHDKGS